MGEVRLRGDVWWIRYYRAGQRHEESARTNRKGEAERLLKIREGDSAKGLPVTPAIGRLTFDDAVADVVTDYRVNGKRSLDGLERRIRLHLMPFFGGRRMVAITTADIRRFIASRQPNPDATPPVTGASNAEINRELAIIRRAFRLALQGGKLLSLVHVPMLRENNVRQGFFEAADFDDVCQALPAALRGVVTFAYYTGWRIRSEVLTLTWGQVDRSAKVVRLDPGRTKSGEGRVLPYALLPAVDDVIEAAWRQRDALRKTDTIAPLVFHRHGKPIRSFRGAWLAACAAAGVAGRIPHDLRRTAVRNLVRAGVPERVAMQVTGHKTRSVFDRYDITSEADLKSALGKLAGTEKGQSARSGRVASFASKQNRKIS
jgi:integrase